MNVGFPLTISGLDMSRKAVNINVGHSWRIQATLPGSNTDSPGIDLRTAVNQPTVRAGAVDCHDAPCRGRHRLRTDIQAGASGAFEGFSAAKTAARKENLRSVDTYNFSVLYRP